MTRWIEAALATAALWVAVQLVAPASAGAGPLTLQVTANRPAVARGDTLTIGLVRQSAGLPGTVVDLYAGVLMTDGQTVLLFTQSGVGVANLASLAAFRACLAVDACAEFTTWGFTDRHSWIPTSFPGFGSALPFDESYHPKDAYLALIATLRGGR